MNDDRLTQLVLAVVVVVLLIVGVCAAGYAYHEGYRQGVSDTDRGIEQR